MREYVQRRRRELGLAMHQTFVPQSYDWGVEAQVDWYEAYADLDGERVKLSAFFDALDGQRRGSSLSVCMCDAAGISRGARTGVRSRRCLPGASLR